MGPTTLLRIAVYYLYVGLLACGGVASLMAMVIDVLAERWTNAGIFLYLSLVLPMAAAGMSRGAIEARRHEARNRQLRRAHPTEPWLCRWDWAEACVVASERDATREKWGVLGAVSLVTAPVAFAALYVEDVSIGPGQRWGLLVLIGALNVWLLQFVVRAGRRWRRTGAATLRLGASPLAPGSMLSGTVQLQQPVVAVEGFSLELRCLERYTSAKARSHDAVRWSHDTRVPAWSGTTLPVSVAIPPDQPPSSRQDGSTSVVWELRVTSQPPRPSVEWVFPLPVFATPAS